MKEKLIRGALGLFLLAGASAVAPAGATAAAGTPAAAPSAVQVPGTSPHTFASTLSMTSPSPSPSGPVDPGTGETKESKETRVEYAPYVIGAVVLAALVASILFWRRRRISHPRKPG